jgi:hypothetical protein
VTFFYNETRNLTKIIFQDRHFNYFIVLGGWRHVFWSDTHYCISLRYTRNIVQLISFYIKFDSKHFLENSVIHSYLYNNLFSSIRIKSILPGFHRCLRADWYVIAIKWHDKNSLKCFWRLYCINVIVKDDVICSFDVTTLRFKIE